MRAFTRMHAQGDVMLIVREDGFQIPPDAKPVERPDGGFVIAHSETGHHHVVRDAGVQMFEPADPLVCYLRLDIGADMHVEHVRGYDQHETLRYGGGGAQKPTIIEVRRQREWAPEGWRRAVD